MKSNTKKGFITFVIFSMLVLAPAKSYARPFIGSEDEIITNSDQEGCIVTTRITYSYFFWIKVGQSEEIISIVC